MENKKVKYALFYCESDYCGDAELDVIGCPDYSLPLYEYRIALAKWFVTNGMQYYSGEKDGIKHFSYKGDWKHIITVVDLDISRPWRLYRASDPEWPCERIMYLDRTDFDNRISPEFYPPIGQRYFEAKKKVKLAVFVSGFIHSCVPIGCPKEYSNRDLKSRMALADWFLKNGKQYYLGENEGMTFYSYKNAITFVVSVVEIDIACPWMFHVSNEDGSERICCLGGRSAFNEIRFKWYPSPTWSLLDLEKG